MSELRRRVLLRRQRINGQRVKSPRVKAPRVKGHRRRLTLAVLPTLLTLGNGTCGLAAIAVAVSDTLPWSEEHKLFVAGLLIFGGMLFDAFDGHAARMTNQSTEFGAQLDSLCDAITFGTAPAVIVWRYSEVLPQRLSWAIGALFTLCVLMRLARFNVVTKEDDPHDSFDGLPSPAAAGTIASVAIAVPHLASLQSDEFSERVQNWAAAGLQVSHYLMPLLAVILAYLMVSRFRYPHVFNQLMGGRKSLHQLGPVLFALFGMFLLHELVLPLSFCYFAFASPVRQLLGRGPAANFSRQPTQTPSTPAQPAAQAQPAAHTQPVAQVQPAPRPQPARPHPGGEPPPR